MVGEYQEMLDNRIGTLPSGYQYHVYKAGDFLGMDNPFRPSGTDGWKIHLSINPEDLPKAWDVVSPILQHANVGSAKFAMPDVAWEFNNPSDPQAGKQITIYDSGDRTWDGLMRDVEVALAKNGIRPSVGKIQGDRMVSGSEYIGYRLEIPGGELAQYSNKDEGGYLSAHKIKQLVAQGIVEPGWEHNPSKQRDVLQNVDFSQDPEVLAARHAGQVHRQYDAVERQLPAAQAPLSTAQSMAKIIDLNGFRQDDAGGGHILMAKDAAQGLVPLLNREGINAFAESDGLHIHPNNIEKFANFVDKGRNPNAASLHAYLEQVDSHTHQNADNNSYSRPTITDTERYIAASIISSRNPDNIAISVGEKSFDAPNKESLIILQKQLKEQHGIRTEIANGFDGDGNREYYLNGKTPADIEQLRGVVERARSAASTATSHTELADKFSVIDHPSRPAISEGVMERISSHAAEGFGGGLNAAAGVYGLYHNLKDENSIFKQDINAGGARATEAAIGVAGDVANTGVAGTMFAGTAAKFLQAGETEGVAGILSKWGSVAESAGKVAGPLAFATSAFEVFRDVQKGDGHGATLAAGNFGGSLLGGALATSTGVGVFVEPFAAMGGGWAGGKAADAVAGDYVQQKLDGNRELINAAVQNKDKALDALNGTPYHDAAQTLSQLTSKDHVSKEDVQQAVTQAQAMLPKDPATFLQQATQVAKQHNLTKHIDHTKMQDAALGAINVPLPTAKDINAFIHTMSKN